MELDHVFGSKWFLNHLARLGFSITSDEVKLYKQSVLLSSSNLIDLPNYSNCSFAQWSADNVDHNTATLDGKKLNVPVIVSVTPKNTDIRSQAIKRLQKKQLVDDILESKGISITKFSNKLHQFPQFRSNNQFKALIVMDSLSDVIWHSAYIFSSQSHPRPNWSGFMQQSVYKNEVEFRQWDVLLLPIIDLSPTDSTLLFI